MAEQQELTLGEQLIAARDAALDCVWSSFNANIMVTTYWHQNRRNDSDDPSKFLSQVAEILDKIEKSLREHDESLTPDALTAIETANRRDEPVKVGGGQFSTHHEAARQWPVAILFAAGEAEVSAGSPANLGERLISELERNRIPLDPEQFTAAIRLESAKALAAVELMDDSPGKDGAGNNQYAGCHVDSDHDLIIINGHNHSVTPDQAHAFNKLVQAQGGWVAGSTLKLDPIGGGRIDRIISRMPDDVKEHIESKTGAGYRLINVVE